MFSGDIIDDELNKISDNDLETVVMMGYCKLVNRKRKVASKEFLYRENQISNHIESFIESGIGKKKEFE